LVADSPGDVVGLGSEDEGVNVVVKARESRDVAVVVEAFQSHVVDLDEVASRVTPQLETYPLLDAAAVEPAGRLRLTAITRKCAGPPQAADGAGQSHGAIAARPPAIAVQPGRIWVSPCRRRRPS
jgi:hypothetical protein